MELDGKLQTYNNKIVRKLILRAYPSAFITSLSIQILMLVTTMVAGFFFTPSHIAAVGVVMPLTTLPFAFLDVFAFGLTVLLSMYLGRNDKQKSNNVFSLALVFSSALSILFVLGLEVFAEPLVKLYGARTPELVDISIQYLRIYAPSMILLQIIMIMNSTHTAFGNHEICMTGTIMNLVLNIVLSIVLVRFTDLGITALGLSALLSKIPTFFYSIIKLKTSKVPIRFSLKNAKMGDLADMLKHGFSSSTDRVIDCLIGGFVNNIVVTWLGVPGLAIFSVVKSIASMGRTAAMAVRMASSALTGILFGARDKNGLRRSFEETLKLGLFFSAIWVVIIVLVMPVLINIFMRNNTGIENAEILIRNGVYVVLAFFPITTIVCLTSSFYEATESYSYALVSLILPDSVIYMLLLIILVPSMGFTGLWLSYGGFCTVFTVLFVIFFMIKNKKVKLSIDDILCLKQSIKDNVPMLDISIKYSNMSVGGVSESINGFLVEHGSTKRTAYMCSLCTEEIVADYISHASEVTGKEVMDKDFLDIKLFSDEEAFKLVIRNASKPYNPLEFEYDPETMKKIGIMMAQKVAKKIEYSSAFSVNIINIDIAK